MPTPGSHAYDQERARDRKRLEDEGLRDEDADVIAESAAKKNAGGPNPASVTDRAKGPKGES